MELKDVHPDDVQPGYGSTEHDRDGIGICKRCGEGLTGLAVVDGEAACSGSTGDA